MEHRIDPVVDEDYIDPSGELVDQIMDIMYTRSTFTIDGIHSNLLMRKHMVDVFDCVKDLESQGLVELVDDDPPCWRLAEASQKHGNADHQPMVQNIKTEEKPMAEDDLSGIAEVPVSASSLPSNTFPQGPQHLSYGHSHSSVGAASQNDHSRSNMPTQPKGGPPPPPSAILFQSLISQSNHPAAPVLTSQGLAAQGPAAQGPAAQGPAAQGGRYHLNSGGFAIPGHIRPTAPYSPDEERSEFSFNGYRRGFDPPENRSSTNSSSRSSGYNQQMKDTSQSSMPQRSGFPSYNHSNNSRMFTESQRGENSNSYQTGFNSGKTGFGAGKSGLHLDDGKSSLNTGQTALPAGQTSFQSGQTGFSPAPASNLFPRPPTAEMFQSLSNQGPQKMPSKGVTSANNRTPNLTPLQKQILECMVKTNKPCETLYLARSCGMKTKKDVNPSLYQLQTWGLVTKMHEKPPTWKLRADNMQLINSLTNSSGHSPAVPPSRPNNDSSSSPLNPFGKRNLSTEDFPSQKIPHFENQPSFSKGFLQAQGFSQSSSGGRSADQGSQHQALSSIVHSSINKNPVSALNEYAQRNRLDLTYETTNEKRGFAVAVVLGGRMFPAARASNSKDARREACDVALRSLLGQNLGGDTQLNVNQPSAGALQGARTHFDLIAALSQHAFVQIAATIDENIAGRKVVACFVMKQGPGDPGKVVSVGSGNRCVTGERLSMEGKVVNDSHAEIVARRSLHRFFYAQIQSFYNGQESIFERRNGSSLLSVKAGVSFHLYISTAPCGDGALFTPRVDDAAPQPQSEDGSHSPEFTSKAQGILRTKIEDGEGTIPIDPNDGTQTWDGLLRGQRLRTMSCSDKICRWNVVGLQGALLTHFIEPIYLASLTLGYLYDHGHLSRAVCCRMQHKSDLGTELSLPFKVNHPLLGRVTAYEASRHTEKTNNLSVNWCYEDTNAEVVDGRTGACLTRTRNQPTPARICKAALYDLFKGVCQTTQRHDLMNFDTYREAKNSAKQFQEAKRLMFECFRKSKYGSWVSKPAEQEMF